MFFFQKTIATILLICLISLSIGTIGTVALYPKKVQAYTVNDPIHTGLQTVWEGLKAVWRASSLAKQAASLAAQLWEKAKKLLTWAQGTILNMLLHKILAALTQDIVDWIQNGDEPRFISEGLSGYLWDAVDQAGGDFVENYLGLGWMCEPFDVEIKIALQEVTTFKDEVTCTLSDVVDNVENFYNDFSEGGWSGWIELTKPQNNFYGAFLSAQEEKYEEEEKAREQAAFDALTGDGFLSMKDCIWYDETGAVVATQTDVRGQPKLPSVCIGSATGPCTYKCETLTPSSVISAVVDKTTTNYWDQLNAQISAATSKAGPYSVYVQAIINALINRVMTEGVGLLKAGTSSDSQGELTEPDYGDLGAASSTPEIVDSQEVLDKISDAEMLLTQLKDVLKYYADRINDIRQDRIDYLNETLDYYNDYTIPSLDNVISACGDVEFEGSVAWATSKKSEIENTTIPAIEAEIERLEAGTESVTDIDASIDAVQAYIDAANDWLDVYDKVYGNSETDLDDNGTPDLEEAQVIMDDAEEYAIETVQDLVTLLSGTTCTSSSFEELTEDVKEITGTTVQEEIDLGNTDNTEKSEAEEIKDEADEYGVQCGDYKPVEVDVTVTITP